MGLIEEITGKLRGQQPGQDAKTPALLSGVLEKFSGGDSGGIQGLVQSFQQKGLGGIISSWIGTGENQPITPDQVRAGLGEDAVRNAAARAGVSEEEASSQLSEHLPRFIDKMTPDGQIPQGGWLEKGMDLIKGKFS